MRSVASNGKRCCGASAAVCFIPVGFTVEALQSGEEPDGAPHFTEGMQAVLPDWLEQHPEDLEAADWLEKYRRFWEESYEKLDDYLLELQTPEKKDDRKE